MSGEPVEPRKQSTFCPKHVVERVDESVVAAAVTLVAGFSGTIEHDFLLFSRGMIPI